ncbi:DMT family transporter [Croceibacterium aestuarii]|uniref:DMT family transporter n=1 Tax=Croceibacterium aestuarii TaxID=3064139 RepID=UPI00272E2989|nr:EamA family transporter [Croceibacterium sp. D39]
MSWNIDPKPPHALLRPAIAVPFILVAVIWGSTWLVIKDQLAAAPVSWSVSYRFFIAAAGMFILAAFLKDRRGFSMTFGGHVMALLIGLTQFFLNFNFVYRAELHLTSGIVAVLFGLLLVPNALLGRLFIGSPVTARFLVGSIVGLAGIALLLKHEAELASLDTSVWLGIAFAFSGILCASIANVLQATKTASRRPLLILLAWAMLWGALADAIYAWAVAGPPVFPSSLRYWSAVGYLGLIGSVVTFPLYFGLIRTLGPGRAAYNGVVVPVVAMALSTVFEGYQWSLLAAAGAALALGGMFIALRAKNVAPAP